MIFQKHIENVQKMLKGKEKYDTKFEMKYKIREMVPTIDEG